MRALILITLTAASVTYAGPPLPRITRHIPTHELSLLSDCSTDQAAAIRHEISVAISLGAPAYNDGDFEACFRVYSNTAIAIDTRVGKCVGARRALMKGVERAATLETFGEKAWAMRDAFDGLLDVIERSEAIDHGETAERTEPPAQEPIERHVPRLPIRALDDCTAPNRIRIAKTIADAIELGAPTYNEGNHDACYRIYQGAAIELRAVPECTHLKRALESAMEGAKAKKSATARAWAMRDVFDGLLEVMSRGAKVKTNEL